MSMVPGCPDDLELTSVLCRLRERGPAVLAARKAVPLRHLRPFTRFGEGPSRPGVGTVRSGLLATAYSETDFETDRAALGNALEAAAGQCGISAFERMRAVADDLSERYLQGPAAVSEIEDLTRAVRDWLPFVSRANFVPLHDGMSGLPELPPSVPQAQHAQMTRTPAMPGSDARPLEAVAEKNTAAAPPASGPRSLHLPPDRYERGLVERNDKAGLMWAAVGYVPWRGLEGDEALSDPRCAVLQVSGMANDATLRGTLYLRHPVLLIIQYLAPHLDPAHPALPEVLAGALRLPATTRAAAMRHVVGLCVGQCRATAFDLEAELAGQVDWSKFRPLLSMGADIIAAQEASGSVVRSLLDELSAEASRSWTDADTFAVKATVLAVAIAVASFGVGGVLAAVIVGIVDLGLQAAAISVHESMVEAQNRERDQFNRLAVVDASLLVASDPENARLGWWLGALSLVMLPVAAAGLVQGAAAIRHARALGEAREAGMKALEAARAATRKLPPGEVGLTRFKAVDDPLLPPAPTPEPVVAPGAPEQGAPAPRSSAVPGRTSLKTAARSPEQIAAYEADRRRLEEFAAGFGGMEKLEDDLARQVTGNPDTFVRLQGEWRRMGFVRESYSFLNDAITRGTARAAGKDPDAALALARVDRSMRRRFDRTMSSSAPSTANSATVRPARGRPDAVGGRGTFIGPIEQKTWSLAPKRWKRVVIDPENPPDLVPDGIVLEFPTGERVWRSAGDDRAIVIESMLGPSSRRRHFERAYFRRGEMDPSYAGHRMELAHSQGQSTGHESLYAIVYAPSEVNQILQNLGIEEFLRAVSANRQRGVTYKLVTATSVHPRSRRLKQITYRVEALFAGESRTLLTTGIRVEGGAGQSAITLAEDLTHIDPEAFSQLPLNDLPYAIADRQREMFARLVQKWKSSAKTAPSHGGTVE